jgi:hypothetical protein
MRLTVLAAVVMTVLAAGSHSRFAHSGAEANEITILSSGSIQGELAPCG